MCVSDTTLVTEKIAIIFSSDWWWMSGMDMGSFLHHGSGIQSMDGCAVDQMEYGTELVPDTSDISYFQLYDEQIGAISSELTFMQQSLSPTMVRSLLVHSLGQLNLTAVATRPSIYPGG